MKRIINGKRYDTDKATLIGEAGPYVSGSDFNYWVAGLYITPRSKVYFLSGEGGAMTQFGKSCADNTRTYGYKIIPLTQEQALEWAEKNLDDDIVEKYFGDIIEDV